MVAVGLLLLGGMMSFGPDRVLAAIGFTPVRDVTNPALQPFHQGLLLSTPNGLLGAKGSFTVPVGKRLVIEFVAFDMSWPTGQETTRAFFGVCNASGNSCPVSYYIPASF
jgi:hypothetical protein